MANLSLALMCPSLGSYMLAVASWRQHMSVIRPISLYDDDRGDSAGYLHKCQRFHCEDHSDIQGYLHSDLFIHEPSWDTRVLAEFSDPNVAIVGFVGAQGLGHEDIYKIPYDYRQLARQDVWSNLSDAEAHGGREPGARSVAVLDSCAIFVRRSFLVRAGGWPVARYPNTSHCSDLWLCCMGHRQRNRVRMVGVSCTHKSGGKGEPGIRWLDEHGGDTSLHRQAHELIYNDFRNELPIRITP